MIKLVLIPHSGSTSTHSWPKIDLAICMYILICDSAVNLYMLGRTSYISVYWYRHFI